MAVRARLTIRGRVQGVWYRRLDAGGGARRRGRRWVKNEHDGNVVAEVEGEAVGRRGVTTWARTGRRARASTTCRSSG
jgi:acylphosphatase